MQKFVTTYMYEKCVNTCVFIYYVYTCSLQGWSTKLLRLAAWRKIIYLPTGITQKKEEIKYQKNQPTGIDIGLMFLYPIIEGSLEVKLPTIWTDEKQSRAEAERRERLEERRVEEKE